MNCGLRAIYYSISAEYPMPSLILIAESVIFHRISMLMGDHGPIDHVGRGSMSDWFKPVSLGIAILGLVLAAPAGAQDEPLDMGMADAMMPLELGQPVPGQYIVVLNDEVSNVRGAASEMARAHGLGLQFIYTNALKGFAASVPEGRLAALERDPRIAYVEQDHWGGIEGRLIAGIDRVNADLVTNTAGTTIIDGVDDLWVNVDVAVIDTGIQIDHPDLNVVGSMNCTTGSPFSPACEAGTGGADDGRGRVFDDRRCLTRTGPGGEAHHGNADCRRHARR